MAPGDEYEYSMDTTLDSLLVAEQSMVIAWTPEDETNHFKVVP